MKKISLPVDIENHVRAKVTKRIASCFALLLLFSLILYFGGERLFGYSRESKIICYTIVILLPFFITGVPIKLIDRSWSGKVVSVKIKTAVAYHTESGSRGVPYTKNTIILLVDTDHGTKRITVNEFGSKLHNGASVPSEGKIEHHTDDYSVGDSVFHFYGLDHPFVIRQNSDTVDCVVCGTQNKGENKTCYDCGHTLIKVIKYKKE